MEKFIVFEAESGSIDVVEVRDSKVRTMSYDSVGGYFDHVQTFEDANQAHAAALALNEINKQTLDDDVEGIGFNDVDMDKPPFS